MTSLASISGLATGIDFRDLVDQIIEVESSRLDYLRLQISGGQSETAAWAEVRAILQALNDASEGLADGNALDVFTTDVLGVNSANLSVSADETATPGRHLVRVVQTATREVMGSALQSSRTDALGVAGEFIIGGTVVDVVAEDSLLDIASRINALNFGANPVGVSASVVGTEGAYRLVMSATDTGEQGLGALDTSGVLTSLGFFDGTTVLKNRTSGGFATDTFTDPTTTVGTLLGFGSGQPAGSVTLGSGASAFNVSLDLGTQSLTDVRDAINSAAAGAGSSMFAELVTQGSGYRLEITGTAAATDSNGVLQALGILEGSRAATSQVVSGDILTTDGSTPATATSTLTSLFNGASPSGAAAGDTIAFSGTDHLGNAFSFTHTIQAGDTLQTLITRLEGAEGFNGGATVEVSVDGRLSVTSATEGSSQLSLQAFAGNEGGGILDLGDFEITTEGRDRQVSIGRDAIVEIDGALVTSGSNDITDVVQGVTFSLLGADPDSELEVVIGRDESAGVEALQAFVDAINALASFVDAGAGVIGDARPPLTGDPLLRGIRDRLNFALQASVPVGASGSVRLADLGVEVTRDGTYALDSAKLTQLLQEDPEVVRAALGSFGSGSTAAVSYVGAGSGTTPGTYAVNITQAASLASVTSVGFGGAYIDDGTADTLTVTNTGSGSAYQVSLSNGMTLAQIIDALNTEFDREANQVVTSERTLYSDSGATSQATDSTLLSDLYHGAGQSSGFVAGTELTFSGTTGDGSAVLQTFTVTDPSTQTLGQVRSAVQSAFGAGTTVSIINGQFVVTDQDAGSSQLSVSIGSDVPGNAAPLGVMQVTSVGRDDAGLVADDEGGELRIRGSSFGSSSNFSVSFTAGGGNGTGSLGLAAGSYTGTDVIGTIGGEAATGVGNILTADTGTTAAGLAVRISGTQTGAVGDITYGQGIMANVVDIADQLLGSDDGSIEAIIKRIGENVERAEDRLFDREERLEVRRQQLLQQFITLEQAIARAQSQQERIAAQIANLPSSGGDS
ncbi:MAG: flagellar filament capping protein FliD [Gemmatimonadota bacterium]